MSVTFPLALLLNSIGELKKKTGDLVGAREAFGEAIDIRQHGAVLDNPAGAIVLRNMKLAESVRQFAATHVDHVDIFLCNQFTSCALANIREWLGATKVQLARTSSPPFNKNGMDQDAWTTAFPNMLEGGVPVFGYAIPQEIMKIFRFMNILSFSESCCVCFCALV